MWFDREIKKLQTGRYEMDCSQIKLVQNAAENPASVEGPGYIKLDSNGQLICKLYSKSISKTVFKLMRGAMIPAGEFYPPDRYFSLHATTVDNKQWNCEDALPALQGLFEEPFAVECPLSFLDTNVDFGANAPDGSPLFQPSVSVYFDGIIDLPSNENYEITRAYKSEKVSEQWESLVHLVDHGVELRIEQFGKGFVASLNFSGDELPRFTESRVREALEFVCGRVMNPVASIHSKGSAQRLRIFSRWRQEFNAEPKPPLGQMIYAHHYRDDVYKLLLAYLKFIGQDESEPYHFLSRQVYGVITSSDLTPDAHALAVCVAVEAILNTCYKSLDAVDSDEKASIECARSLVEQSTLDEKMKTRMDGLLKSWCARSPKSKLWMLSTNGVTSEPLIRLWGKLRNDWAHPGADYPWDISSITQMTDSVRTLFYQLTFDLIGYQGKYADYSELGWPKKDFPTPKEQPPIA